MVQRLLSTGRVVCDDCGCDDGEERVTPTDSASVDEGRSPCGQGWQVGAAPVVRLAGVPVSALAGLRCERSFAQIERLIALDAWLGTEGAALSEALYAVIGAVGDANARPGLVGLRRAVHRVRMPSTREWNPALASLLPADLAQRVEQWVDRCADRKGVHGDVPGVLAEERKGAQASLRQALAHPGFRRALSQAAPTLLDEVDKWLVDQRHQLKPQKLLRLVKYLARAAAKTSPYSTFMSAGFGQWSQHGPAIAFRHPAEQPLGVLELDGPHLEAIRTALTSHPQLAGATRVRVNPSVIETEGRLRFLAAAPTESIITLEAGPAVRECLRLLEAEGGSTLAQLREGLQSAASASDPAKVDRFVDRLLTTGLLQASIPVDEQSTDLLGELGQWVRAHCIDKDGDDHLSEVSTLLAAVRTHLRRGVPVADVHGHRVRQDALHHALTELSERLGVDQTSIQTTSDDVFHETAVMGAPVATCSLRQWRPALSDLDVVRRFLAVFDANLPERLVLGSYCRQRFGSGAQVSLLTFHHAVQQELARAEGSHTSPAAADLATLLGPAALPWMQPQLGALRLDRLHLLDKLQAQARETALGCPGPDGVARVDPGVLTELVATWPEWITAPDSVGYYVQPYWSGQTLGLVLNAAHGGHGRNRSRLRHMISRATAAGGPPEPGQSQAPSSGTDHHQERARPSGPVLAELSGTLSSTLNVRLPTLPYEIDYPFTVSGRPQAQRIPLHDLNVVHDPRTDLVSLFSTRLGAQVLPRHLGMLADFVMPAAALLLVRAFGGAGLVHASMPPLIGVDWMRLSEPGELGEIVRHPRVEVGRVVLQRARWFVPAELVPRRAKGERDADFLLRLVAWLRQQAIPDRVFVRVMDRVFNGERVKDRKPVFIDFANPWLVADFERQVGPDQLVIIDEALPDPYQAQDPTPEQAHVTELLVELCESDSA
jgi:Lantibiotic dehydratase, N terminus